MGRVWWVGWLGQHLLQSHMTTGAAKLWCLASRRGRWWVGVGVGAAREKAPLAARPPGR